MIECNARNLQDNEYDSLRKWGGTSYFGASLLALKKFGDS